MFDEIYAALRGGQHRLALMGIRAFFEQLMIAKTGDLGSFHKNIEAFREAGYISLLQRDSMAAILDVGHAVIHRLFKPTERDLHVALDIAEGIFASIYIHGDAAARISDRVPRRK